jgi:ribonuclease BN (tRNA processing enzyme)
LVFGRFVVGDTGHDDYGFRLNRVIFMRLPEQIYRDKHHSIALGTLLIILCASMSAVSATHCGPGIALQVLGSGGPMVNNKRASAGYVIWVDEKARILLETGGGTYARFGNTGAAIDDLRLIAISHLHVDHATDLSAYIKGGYFTERKSPLPIAGPSAANGYPGITDFLQRLFGKERGAFSYLSGTLDGTAGQFETPAIEISVQQPEVQMVMDEPELRVMALPVKHGPVPTLAYRMEVNNRVIVYGADQNGDEPRFARFAKDADLLIMPLAIAEDETGPVLKLHAKPSEVGSIAVEGAVERLLLSHVMPAVEPQLEETLNKVRSVYKGPVTVAEDLMCVEFR